MTVTTTTQLSNSVVTAYDADYLLSKAKQEIWYKLFRERMLRKVIGGGNLKGQTVTVPVYAPLSVPTAHLTETMDVTPEAMVDDAQSVTIYEEGNVVQTTHLLDITSYVDIGKPAAEMVGENQAKRIDNIIRDAVVFGATDIMYGGTATSRVTCDVTNDKVTFAKIVAAEQRARSRGVKPFPDGSYISVVNGVLKADLVGLAEWINPGEYVDPSVIFTGELASLEKGAKLPFELGMLGNVRLVGHPNGKLFLGAGTAAQAATTLSAAVAAGATTCTVADATGLAVGDWITVGTLESSTTAYPTTERVLITAVNSLTLTVRGAGTKHTNWGFKFAHASGASVIEADNVCPIPIMGPESLVIAYASDPGPDGRADVEYAPTNIPRRFLNHSWYWVGGAAAVDKNLVVLEVATTGQIYGNS